MNYNLDDQTILKYANACVKNFPTFLYTSQRREDALCEALFGICKGLKTYNPNRNASLDTWVTNCGKWQLCEAMEEICSDKALFYTECIRLDMDDSHEITNTDIMQNVISRINNELVCNKLLSCLTEREKDYIFLKYFEGRTQLEIAEMQGCTKSNISCTFHRIMDKLRKQAAELGLKGYD